MTGAIKTHLGRRFFDKGKKYMGNLLALPVI